MKYYATAFAAGVVGALLVGTSVVNADGYAAKKASYHHEPACDAAKFGGFYFGVHGGGGSLTSTETNRDIALFLPGGSNQQVSEGAVAGGQIGYNFARCKTVFGIEADFSWANFDESRDYTFFGAPFFTINHKMDWLSSVRTKAGVAVGDMFLFATGGVAFANIDSRINVGGFDFFKSDDTRVGWVAGVGSEYAITDRVRLTGEVMYYDFGTQTVTDQAGIGFRMDDHHSLWVTRVGLNFKLGADSHHYEAMK